MARVRTAYWLNITAMALVPAGMVLFGKTANADAFNDDWRDQLQVFSFSDATTDDNASPSGKKYIIDPGADAYSQEVYERPTSQMDTAYLGVPASRTYYEFLDIDTGEFALDSSNQTAYFSLNMIGDAEISNGTSTVKGFSDYYRVRASSESDFALGESGPNSFMFGVKDPSGKLTDSFSSSGAYESTQVWVDDPSDGSVAGTGIGTTAEGTLGFAEYTSEGASSAIRARLNGNSIELAVDYGALDIEQSVFTNLIFEANKGVTDVSNSFFNDAYTLDEAGTPYDLRNRPENIYEVDTLAAGVGGSPVSSAPAPVPGIAIALLSAFGVFWRRRVRGS